MKTVVIIFVILNIFLVKTSLQASTNVLKLSLYYEALCPGCRAFITQQLYPSYKKIGSSLLLDLTPYGNAQRQQVNGTWVFTCQHGPDECALNKLEACGLVTDCSQDMKMEFVYCVETHTEKSIKKIAKCASKLGVTAREILKCAQGPEGNELLAKLADKQDALDPKIEYVPWIIFNDQPHNPALQEKAEDDFLKTACDLLSDKPNGCASYNEIPNN